MSKQAVEDFLSKIQTDPDLSQTINQLHASTQAIKDLALQHGFIFTFEELEAVLPERPDFPDASSESELSQEELEQVAGGTWSGSWKWDSAKKTWVWVWVWDSP